MNDTTEAAGDLLAASTVAGDEPATVATGCQDASRVPRSPWNR
jgi:hypothetical protein